jgi:hypothetical protein
MAVSATAARIYINVPDALDMNQAALDATYAGIKALNATAVRITVSWKAVQPSQPTYFTWTATDQAVNRAAAAGLRVLLVLSPPKPWWTATVDPAKFALFAGAAAKRYKGRVAEYQIWDEPNVVQSWPGTTAVNPATYGAVLKASRSAIKAADPAALVVFGGLQACTTQTPAGARGAAGPVRTAVEPVEFLKEIFGSISGDFDILAYHPRSVSTAQNATVRPPSGDTIAQHDRLYQAMSTPGARGTITAPTKKVYWTAVGYDMAQYTTAQQAYFLDTIRRLAQTRPEVTGLGVYSFRDFLV